MAQRGRHRRATATPPTHAVAAMLMVAALSLYGCSSQNAAVSDQNATVSSLSAAPTQPTSDAGPTSPTPAADTSTNTSRFSPKTLGPDDDVPPIGVGLIRPGPLPAGEYRTTYFPAQLSVTLTGGDWTSNEDSTGEFSLSLPHGTSTSDLLFWQDVTPVEADGTVTAPVGPTAADLVTWLRNNEALVVTDEPDVDVAGLSAKVVDLDVAPTVATHDPGCPARACVYVLSYPLWDDSWAFASGMGVRLWTFDRPDGNRMVVVAQTEDRASLDAFAPEVDRVLSTVTFG